MGIVTQEYAASANLVVTNLHSLASSAGLLAGWGSETIDNTATKHADKLISAKFVKHASNTTAGQIQVWAFAMLDDTTWPDFLSSGTEGTEGAATIIDDEQKNEVLRLLWSTATDTTASDIHNMPPSSVAGAFGGIMPAKFALFITGVGGTPILASSGSQVTVKGLYYSVA